MKKNFKIGTLIIAGSVGLYFVLFGAFYGAGYRVYRIPTLAMKPTIQQGDRVIGRLSDSYRSQVKRLDLVLFRTPQFPGQIFVKRVIGLPGEHVTVGPEGLKIDGAEIELPLAIDRAGFGRKKCDVLVPSDAFFVLGDFTPSSLDSRYIGSIPRSDILGYLVFRK